MIVPPRAALAGLLALTFAAVAVPRAAHAQRDRCRYYADGRWYPCQVEDGRRDAERARQRARAREQQERARAFARRRSADRRDGYGDGDFYVPRRQLSLQVGALRYDENGRETIPAAALRGDFRLTRLLRSELGVSYGFGDLPRVAPAAVPGLAPSLVRAHALAATVGVLGELPTPVVRPYAGVAAGLFGRFDERGGGGSSQRFVRPTLAFPVGVRAYVSPRLALRGEARFRFDQLPSGASATNTEFTAGLSVGY